MADIKTIILNTPTESLERILSPFIEEQFPSFVRSDYRKLILFIKAYYEWLEKEGNPGFANSYMDTVFDIDQNLEIFYSYFKKTFIDTFPEIFSTNSDGLTPNKKTLLKKIKQFYGNKGTESAYKFLFRLLFDSTVQFYYPKKDVLRASSGEWVEQISIKITRVNESLHSFIEGGKVQQYKDIYTLRGYADIDRAVQYYQDGVPVTELYLTNLVGEFLPNAQVLITPSSVYDYEPFEETTFSVLGDFYIKTAGENYKVGDVVYLQQQKGTGFSAKVQQTGLAGSVKRIQIENSGINYVESISALVINSNGTNSNAEIVFSPSAITRYPGYFKGNAGKISSTPKIYDGDFYQEFSYELKSSVSIDKYYSILKDLVHPSGTKMFGSILLEDELMCEHVGSTQLTRIGIPVLGNYLPYTFGTTLDLRNNGVTSSGSWFVNYWGTTLGTTGDLYPAGYNPYISGTADVGPNGRTAPAGTTFFAGGSGGKLGYTYCLVPESGRTAHDPLGAPLGGITAWLLGNESRLDPDVFGKSPMGLVGLTLWLKPENIGVCGGSLITGRSMDIWRDASPSQNHAVPPKWDLWDGDTVLYARKRAGGNNWNESVWNTNPCDNIEFRVGNYGPPVQGISQANGNGFMVGFWGNVGGGNTAPLGTGGNVTNDGYKRLDFSIYILTADSGAPRLVAYEIGRTGGSFTTLSGDQVLGSYTTSTIFGLSHDKVNNKVNYYRKDTLDSTPTLLRSPGVSAGEVFYADSSWAFTTSNCQIVKAQNNGVDLPLSGWTGTSNMQFAQVKGLTVDKLRPTLIINDRGIAGRTGIEFNGGVLYGPHTVWTQAGLCGGYAGVTLGANGVAPFVSGFTGERIQSGRFFTLTRGISLNKDMSVFIVFRAGPTGASGYTASNYGLGLVSSSKPLYNFSPSVEQTRTNVLSNTADLSNTTNWPSAIAGTGVASTRTYGVFDPLGTKTATRFVFDKGAGTTAGHYSLVLQGLPSTVVGGSNYSGFLWVKGIAAGGTLAFRHAAGSNYLLIPVTTSWRKHYVQEIAASTPQNFGFGLRGDVGTSNSLTVDIWSPELFAGSGLAPFVGENDHLLYNRSYNNIDTDPTKLNSTNYFVNSGNNQSFYPYESGLVGIRNNVGITAGSRIAYNPYTSTLSGVSLENISIGEWRRNRDNRIQSFYNGLESKNYSIETARRIARVDSPGGSNPLNFAASEVSYNENPMDFGRVGAFCLPVLDSSFSNSSTSFASSALANAPLSFNGVIYEILVYDRVLDQNERLSVYAYLSKKYRLENVLGEFFEGAGFGCYPAAVAAGYPYWYVSKHPNTVGSKRIPQGISMGNMTIQDFISLYGLVYKSAGTKLSDGTVLTEDTYDTLGD